MRAFVLLMLGAMAYGQTPPDRDPEIVTDRPDVTEASTVVPKGSLQFENGLTWTGGRGSSSFDVAETLVRYGIASRTEIRVVIPNYIGGLSGRDAVSGFDDFALGLKQQIGPLRGGVDLSVIVALSMPTGANRVSSHGFDPFVKFPWSKDLKRGWSIGGMQSFFWYTRDGRRNGDWQPTFYVEKAITAPWDAFVEFAGDYTQRGAPQEIIHYGTAYRFRPRQQVDFHFGFGLSHAAPERFFAVGYSFRIDPPRDR
jgi:outer membrane putative beta-barrel porin/alpha-amylase